jgi:hypothetical protein
MVEGGIIASLSNSKSISSAQQPKSRNRLLPTHHLYLSYQHIDTTTPYDITKLIGIKMSGSPVYRSLAGVITRPGRSAVASSSRHAS